MCIRDSVHARELRSEQMRLLYVALTRAQDKLILTVPLSLSLIHICYPHRPSQ